MITLKVSDLWAVANLMKSDKMKYITLHILKSDDEEPDSLCVSAIQSLDDYEIIDYDPIDAVPDSPLF